MAKRKNASTDADSAAKKVKPLKAAPIAKAAKQSTRPSATKAAVDAMVDTPKVVARDDVIVKEQPRVDERDFSSVASNEGSVISINDEDEYDLYTGEDDDTNAPLIASDDHKVDEIESVTVVGGSDEVVGSPNAITTKNEEAPKVSENTEAEAGIAVAEDESQFASSVEEIAETGSNNEWMAEYAREALTNGIQTQLTLAPAMLSTAGATTIGDTIDLNFNVNGLKLRVSLKIVGVEEPAAQDDPEDANDNAASEPTLGSTMNDTTNQSHGLTIDTEKAQTALQTAAPMSANVSPSDTRAHIPCKFADSCSKGDACPFDHTVVMKKKLCTWVNTTKGCAKGDKCHFSHDHKGKVCTKSTSRMKCENGATCAFEHKDDDGAQKPKKAVRTSSVDGSIPDHASKLSGIEFGSVSSSKQESLRELLSPAYQIENQDHAQDTSTESYNAYETTVNVPTGPKNLGKGAGLKRHAEGEGNGYDAPRPHKHNNHNNRQQNVDAPTGPQNAQGGRKFAQGRGGGNGWRGKNRGRGGKQHNP